MGNTVDKFEMIKRINDMEDRITYVKVEIEQNRKYIQDLKTMYDVLRMKLEEKLEEKT